MTYRPVFTLMPLAFLFMIASCFGYENFPLHLNPEWDYPVLGVGLIADGYGFIEESERTRDPIDPAQYRSQNIPFYDRWAIGYYSPTLSKVSTVLVIVEGLTPVAFTGSDWYRGQEDFSEAWTEAVLYGEVAAYSSAISLGFQSLRIHPRPLVFTDNAPYSERSSGSAGSSFISEHTTTAFAAGVYAAYTFQLKHPGSSWIPWVWSGALSMASATAILRVYSGNHFPSDVVAGAAVGATCGFLVPWLHTQQWRLGLGRNENGKERELDLGLGLTSIQNFPLPVPTLNMRF